MHHSSNGTEDEGYRRTLVTAEGVSLIVELHGSGVVLIVGSHPVRLTHVEARRLGVIVLLGAVLAKEVEEL